MSDGDERIALSAAEVAAMVLGRFVRVELGRWVRLPNGLKARSALVGRAGGRVVAYANVCMHHPLPLDLGDEPELLELRDGAVRRAPMTYDGRSLLCHAHGAVYRPADGVCTSGPCAGMSLAPIAVDETPDGVVLRVP
jgi:nitrite reductase/ring-hydroxylating ferredoxin subunit